MVLVTCTVRLAVALEESVNVAVATTPLAIALGLIPVRRHVYKPLPPKQLSVFDAALALAPGVIFTEVKSAVE